MINNDILRRIRYILDYNDAKMIEVFALAEHSVTRSDIHQWLQKEDHADFVLCKDEELAIFLNGLISEKRGKKEGPQPIPEKRLNNNIIFRKLKIAFNLIDEEMLVILKLGGIHLSKSELSAFFRKTDHKHYRECQNQVLRNFLKGLQLKLRPSQSTESGFQWKTPSKS